MNATNAGPKGIGGWLALPALALILSPIRMGYDIYTQVTLFFSDSLQALFTDPTSQFYHPMWNVYICGMVASNVALVAATLYVARQFFIKSPRLPMLYVMLLLASLAVQAVDVAVVKFGGFPGADTSDAEVYRDLVKSILVALIWIPYFLISKRVRNTFTAAPSSTPRVEHREPVIDDW